MHKNNYSKAKLKPKSSDSFVVLVPMNNSHHMSKSDEYLPHKQNLESINDMFSRGWLCNHCQGWRKRMPSDGSCIDERIVCGKATYCYSSPLTFHPPPNIPSTNPSLIKNNHSLVRAKSLVLISPPFWHQSAFPTNSTAN